MAQAPNVPDRKTIKTAFVQWLIGAGLLVLGNVSGNVWMIRLTDALPELRFNDVRLQQGRARYPHHPTAATPQNPMGTAYPTGNYLLTLPFTQPVKLRFEASTSGGPIVFDGGDDIASTWQLPITYRPYWDWEDLGLAGIEKLGIRTFTMTVTPADESEPLVWTWRKGGSWEASQPK